jgi:amino-acid N-acetyltransferase
MTYSTLALPQAAPGADPVGEGLPSSIALRTACGGDLDGIHALIATHVESDHLLPRTREEIAHRLPRFVVAATDDDELVGCAELAPLSGPVAEVRSLVVTSQVRGVGVGRAMLDALARRARLDGHARLCAFTHKPAYFLRLGFSIVPHVWVREKIAVDCVACPLFRTCGQHAVVLPLDATARHQRRGAERVQ